MDMDNISFFLGGSIGAVAMILIIAARDCNRNDDKLYISDQRQSKIPTDNNK